MEYIVNRDTFLFWSSKQWLVVFDSTEQLRGIPVLKEEKYVHPWCFIYSMFAQSHLSKSFPEKTLVFENGIIYQFNSKGLFNEWKCRLDFKRLTMSSDTSKQSTFRWMDSTHVQAMDQCLGTSWEPKNIMLHWYGRLLWTKAWKTL